MKPKPKPKPKKKPKRDVFDEMLETVERVGIALGCVDPEDDALPDEPLGPIQRRALRAKRR